MEKIVKGDVVVIRILFTDLSSDKKRPALVIANLGGEDLILCQITSKEPLNNFVKLTEKDFLTTNLEVNSFVRVDKIFTLDSKMIEYKIGKINQDKITQVETKLIQIITI
ncbi:MAG: type II toxin-antitoxin system PemK/MazF family toxin [Sphaerochaetaceae bacterium]|nr:type II toxin-antitoxin system PemK/MazF family toxin [Sphaerochaetaceae bacterium]